MKKIIFILFAYFFSCICALALEDSVFEDIVLEEEKLNLPDYFANVYYGKEEYDEAPGILKLFSQRGIEFESKKVNSVRALLLYDARLNYNYQENGPSYLQHKFVTLEPMILVKFNENRSEAMLDVNFLRNMTNHSNWFTQKISRVYVSHKLNENQTIILGEGVRLPTTYNGSLATMQQEFVIKSQLGRTFGDIASVGIRNTGNYKYIDYDIGVYDSTRYMQHFGRGADFTGFVMFKPIENFKDKAGSLKIGSGYNVGKYNSSYSQYSVYTGYDYKKFHIKAEYASADGYNGIKDSQNDADGLYTTVSFDITPKLTLLSRFDTFDSNKHINKSNTEEYTVGLLIRPYKNMKLIMNYVYKNPANQRNSNMILFASRVII